METVNVIIVAGGRDANGTILKSVEIYSPQSEDWIPGPDLPQALYEPTLVPYGNIGVVLAGIHF